MACILKKFELYDTYMMVNAYNYCLFLLFMRIAVEEINMYTVYAKVAMTCLRKYRINTLVLHGNIGNIVTALRSERSKLRSKYINQSCLYIMYIYIALIPRQLNKILQLLFA